MAVGFKSPVKTSFGQKLLASACTLTALVFLPIILTFAVLPILLIRLIVARLASILHPEFSKILTHRTTNLSLEELHSHTENAILADYVFEGNYPLETCRARFAEQVLHRKLPNGDLKYPELRQYVVTWMNFKFWKNQEDFDINDHFSLYNETRPGGSPDSVVTQKEFEKMRNNLMNSAFPEHKSPWEMVLVHNYVPDDPILRGRTDKPLSVMMLKIHHSLGDGYSIKKLLAVDWYGNSELEKPPTRKPADNHKDKFCFLEGVKILCDTLTFPIRCLYEFMTISVLLMKKGAWHVPQDRQAPAVHTLTNIISVARVKWIKDQLGVSFTSILFHVCNEATQKIMAKKRMEATKSILSVFPLPLPNHPDKLRNHMTHGSIPLPTSPELSPQVRLRIVHSHYEGVKSSTLPFSLAWVSLIVGGMFTRLARLLARGLVPPIIISSFPGSQHSEWRVDGHKLLSSYVSVGLLNMSGLVFTIMSYGDNLKFGLTANSYILNEDDIQEFADILEREIDILEDEVTPHKVSVASKSEII